ncbi:hypothetical protein DH2020_007053 [Rehmannia glutinosa]|uniref:Uncharacterized protein n=1 Tax=Rehmannia glutinosa TaxID=99300 RepID=A0ABR0TWT8_REHGL
MERAGMRVAMEVETEDSTRMVSGRAIMAVASPESGPWRALRGDRLVTWDQDVSEVLPKDKGVCPWQVVYVPSTSHLHPEFPLLKKLKPSPNQGSSTMIVLTAGDSEFPFPSTRQMVATGFDYPSPLPAGMQGARPDLRDDNSPHQTFTQLLTNCIEPETKTAVPEILHPNSENFLPGSSQSSVQFPGTDLVGSNSSAEAGSNSFRLFGQTIRTPEPVDDEGQINVAIDPPHDISRVDGQL